MNLRKTLPLTLSALLILASGTASADWTNYPIKGKFIHYSYEVLSGNKKGEKGGFMKLKLLSNYSKAQDIEIKNLSISYLSRVDYVTVNCAEKSKQLQISAFELYEDADGKGWNYKGTPKKIKWDKVPKNSTLDSLLKDVCSGT